jgi:hypothetical protein
MKRRSGLPLAAATLALSGTATMPAVYAADISLNPKATYLHVCNDAALNAPAISLAGLGFLPGETIQIEVLGDWDCGSPCADTEAATGAVFSASATLLGGASANRVPDAIAAGMPAVTGNTFWCNTPTDIPADFRVDPSTTVVIPAGATHLFIGALDSLFDDNTDPDGDYAVRITSVIVPVETTTWGRVKSLYR